MNSGKTIPSSPIKSPQSSPVWKRPSDIMRMRRAKRRSSTGEAKPLQPHNQSPSPLIDKDAVKQTMKRRNPFSCSPRKRRHTDSEGGDFEFDDSDFMLFRMLKTADDKLQEDNHNIQNIPDVLDKITNRGAKKTNNATEESVNKSPFVEPASPPTQEDEETPEPFDGKELLPLDWSMKMKIRFVSSDTFSWCTPLKTTEEAAGISAFVRAKHTDVEQGDINSSHKTAFQQCCMYWMHPNLPWLKLFPRIVPDNKIGKSVPLLQDEEVIKTLHNDWINSFTSVFQSVRAKHCPYFYMCTHQFTVLFRMPGLGGHSHINAVLTPTTRGFREALRKEGIEFTMPFLPKDDTPTIEIPEPVIPAPSDSGEKVFLDDEEEEEEDIDNTDEGAQSWLESIGLDKKKFPELRPEKIKMQREGYKVIDSRPESTVCVQGGDTQAMFNYLLNCRSCFASSGVQYGVPPTILAPMAFKGAVLKSLKVKQGLLRLQPDKTNQKGYSMELEGPILPNTQTLMCDLLGATQHGEFMATLGIHEPTTPFNILSKDSVNPVDLSHSGLDQICCDYCRQDQELERTGLREIQCKHRLYSWTVG